MDRKDVYDHLAKIYLDASSKTKRKKKHKGYSKTTQGLFVIGTVALLSVVLGFLISVRKNKPLGAEIALVFTPEAVKINFNFDPAKKETYTLNLSNLKLKHFKTLAFSVKKAQAQGNVSLSVELTSSFKEKSEVYLRNVGSKWQDYRINLSDFKGIAGWPAVSELSFIVEEWNASSKKGIVYLDNVRLLK
jgi:hypothetical protein